LLIYRIASDLVLAVHPSFVRGASPARAGQGRETGDPLTMVGHVRPSLGRNTPLPALAGASREP
jgi:hypothetical protein